MQQTPGQILDAALVERGIGRSAFARSCGVSYMTVLRWCADRGFPPDARKKAALALRLPVSHFEAPDDTEVHERKCQKALEEALRNVAVSEAERMGLSSIRIPIEREPTAHFYTASLLLLRDLPSADDVADARADLKLLRTRGRKPH